MDSFTETTTRSWGSRLGGSFKGILVGIVLFVLAFPVLWWNEGRMVERYQALEEGAGLVVSVSSEAIDPANEGRLIHTSGTATTEESLTDPEFGISGQLLLLERQVEMYQWRESTESKTEKNLGGSETTTTTYSYDRAWSSTPIDSSAFRQPDAHENPATMPDRSTRFTTSQARLGAFRLSQGQVQRLHNRQPVPLAGKTFDHLDRSHRVLGDSLFIGRDPDHPEIGDLRIVFQQMPASPVSIVGQQQDGGMTDYRPRAGSAILLIADGLVDAEAMFQAAQQENTFIAWLLRILGFALMFIGLKLILGPLSTLGDVVPFIGSLIAFGAGTLAFLIALPLSLVVIALAWIFYRPLLAGGILALALATFVLPWWLKRGKAAASPAGP